MSTSNLAHMWLSMFYISGDGGEKPQQNICYDIVFYVSSFPSYRDSRRSLALGLTQNRSHINPHKFLYCLFKTWSRTQSLCVLFQFTKRGGVLRAFKKHETETWSSPFRSFRALKHFKIPFAGEGTGLPAAARSHHAGGQSHSTSSSRCQQPRRARESP